MTSHGQHLKYVLRLVRMCVSTQSAGFTTLQCSVAKCNICKTVVASRGGKTSDIMKRLQTQLYKSKQYGMFELPKQSS